MAVLIQGIVSFTAFAAEEDIAEANVQRSLNWDGLQIMEEVHSRHQQFPYIYEEQSMVMVDRNGYRDTRKARRYSRVEEDGSVRFLLLFESPREVKGVALLANRDPSGKTEKSVYLPAFGEQLFESISEEGEGNFLGTDFSVENLTGEVLDDYKYVRIQNMKMGEAQYFVVDVYRKGDQVHESNRLRRHYIRQDNFFIAKTTHFDKQGRVYKVQSHHDLRPVDGNMWRAGMILMNDQKEQHQSLIKIERRIFSRDYVPPEMFTEQWLYENYSRLQQADASGEIIEDEVDPDLGDQVTLLMNAQQEMVE